MYKTTVNGRITHPKQQISEKNWHYSAVHWHGNVICYV